MNFKYFNATSLQLINEYFHFRPTVFDLGTSHYLGWDVNYGLCMHLLPKFVYISWNGMSDIDIFLTMRNEGASLGYHKFSVNKSMKAVAVNIRKVWVYDDGVTENKYPDFILNSWNCSDKEFYKFYDRNVCIDRCVQLTLKDKMNGCRGFFQSLQDQMDVLCLSNWEERMKRDLCSNDEQIIALPNYKLCYFKESKCGVETKSQCYMREDACRKHCPRKRIYESFDFDVSEYSMVW